MRNLRFYLRLVAACILVAAVTMVISEVYVTLFTKSLSEKVYYDGVIAKVDYKNKTYYYTPDTDFQDLSYPDFQEGDFKVVFLTTLSNSDYFYTVGEEDGVIYQVSHPKYENFRKDLLERGLIIKEFTDIFTPATMKAAYAPVKMFLMVLKYGFLIVAVVILYFYFADPSKLQNLLGKRKIFAGQSTSGVPDSPIRVRQGDAEVEKKVMFADVIGLDEVKKDVMTIVDFLQNKSKYLEAGVILPRGIIFWGEPGTGKTLLAKAIANEAGVQFLYRSGSDFVETYVGVGAKRIRELFQEARNKAPCIIFIDEIDAIGGKRGKHDENSEDRKTINALLTEMDGFNPLDDVIVIGATNRLEDLDSALTREGRFTDKFCIPAPANVGERVKVLEFYTRNKRLGDDVDLTTVAKECVGMSPAALANLMNEAAIISVQDDSAFIRKAHIDKAFMKVALQGHVKEDQTGRSREELELVAWHEAGHALVARHFGEDVTKVTILSSTSGAGGVTFSVPDKEHMLSVSDLKHRVMKCYGGRVAERLLYGSDDKITTGASNDIEQATKMIHSMVTCYGMDEEFGMLNLNLLQVSQREIIKREVELAKTLEVATVAICMEQLDILRDIAESLLERETLYSKDLDEIFEKYAIST